MAQQWTILVPEVSQLVISGTAQSAALKFQIISTLILVATEQQLCGSQRPHMQAGQVESDALHFALRFTLWWAEKMSYVMAAS